MTSTTDHTSRMNRRSFLHRPFSGAVVSLGTARPGLHVLSSAGKRISTIGLQLYTVRRELETDFVGTIIQISCGGFGVRRVLACRFVRRDFCESTTSLKAIGRWGFYR